MTRETKLGLVVSCSFLCLLGTVLYFKMTEESGAANLHAKADGNLLEAPGDPTPIEVTVTTQPQAAGSPPPPTIDPKVMQAAVNGDPSKEPDKKAPDPLPPPSPAPAGDNPFSSFVPQSGTTPNPAKDNASNLAAPPPPDSIHQPGAEPATPSFELPKPDPKGEGVDAGAKPPSKQGTKETEKGLSGFPGKPDPKADDTGALSAPKDKAPPPSFPAMPDPVPPEGFKKPDPVGTGDKAAPPFPAPVPEGDKPSMPLPANPPDGTAGQLDPSARHPAGAPVPAPAGSGFPARSTELIPPPPKPDPAPSPFGAGTGEPSSAGGTAAPIPTVKETPVPLAPTPSPQPPIGSPGATGFPPIPAPRNDFAGTTNPGSSSGREPAFPGTSKPDTTPLPVMGSSGAANSGTVPAPAPIPGFRPTPSADPSVPLGRPLNSPVPGDPLPTIPSRPLDPAPESAALSRPFPPLGTSTAGTSSPSPIPQAPRDARVVASATPQVESYDEETYLCRANESFENVSLRFYNSKNYAQALMLFNRNHPRAANTLWKDPPVLQEGQQVYIPPVRILEKQYGGNIAGNKPIIPAAQPAPAVAPSVPVKTSAAPPVPEKLRYRVRQSEMIPIIARDTLGNPERWTEIYQLNRRSFDPSRPLPPGTVLLMPADAKIPRENSE